MARAMVSNILIIGPNGNARFCVYYFNRLGMGGRLCPLAWSRLCGWPEYSRGRDLEAHPGPSLCFQPPTFPELSRSSSSKSSCNAGGRVGRRGKANGELKECFNDAAHAHSSHWCSRQRLSLNASEYHGVVRFGGLPVPGAAVTAQKGDQTVTAITDPQGAYTFPDLADGTWNVRVDMLGFAVTKQDVTVAPNAPPAELELKMLPFAQIHAEVKTVAPAATTAAATPETPSPAKPAPAKPGAFQRTEVNATNAGANAAPPAPGTDVAAAPATSELSQRAADGFLVNGSVNNGAASPFAQFGAFGNGRRLSA